MNKKKIHLVATHRWRRPRQRLCEHHVYTHRILRGSKPCWPPPRSSHKTPIPCYTPCRRPRCHCQWSDTQAERRARWPCRRDRSLCSSLRPGLPRFPWSGSRNSPGASRFGGSRGRTLTWSPCCATARLWFGIRHRRLPKEALGNHLEIKFVWGENKKRKCSPDAWQLVTRRRRPGWTRHNVAWEQVSVSQMFDILSWKWDI